MRLGTTRSIATWLSRMAKLAHPNVVLIHEINQLGDTAFLVMEYVEGGPRRRP